MVDALSEAVTGALYQQMRLDVLSNNLANMNTAGYKKDNIVFHVDNYVAEDGAVSKEMLTQETENSAALIPARTFIDYSQGQLEFTGNKCDLALGEEGFYSIKTPQGTQYARAGNFTLNDQGILCTQEGFPVLGQSGEITLSSANFKVDETGKVSVEGIPAGTLKIVSFKDSDLLKAGNNLFSKAREDVVEGSPGEIRVMQGYIEKSNVNPVKMMTDMIDTLRGFESYQKVIQYLSETTASAINKVGETF